MTREPESTTNALGVRANGKSLFFNNLNRFEARELQTGLADGNRFAQACIASLSIQHVAIAEHRPASRPGAD
jgi:hypothetical protein